MRKDPHYCPKADFGAHHFGSPEVLEDPRRMVKICKLCGVERPTAGLSADESKGGGSYVDRMRRRGQTSGNN